MDKPTCVKWKQDQEDTKLTARWNIEATKRGGEEDPTVVEVLKTVIIKHLTLPALGNTEKHEPKTNKDDTSLTNLRREGKAPKTGQQPSQQTWIQKVKIV